MINILKFHAHYILITVITLMTMILILYPEVYNRIIMEDQAIEYLTALFFLGCVIILMLTTIKVSGSAKLIALIATVLFLFIVGEEVSWGQRILGFSTPESLMEINDQNEFNLHNVNKKFFDRALDWVIVLFVFIAVLIKRFKTKNEILGFPLPNHSLLLCFCIVPFYRQYNDGLWNYHLAIIPILVFYVITMKDRMNYSYKAAVFISVLMMTTIYFIHMNYQSHFSYSNNSANEIREMLFSLSCMGYSYYIFSEINATTLARMPKSIHT